MAERDITDELVTAIGQLGDRPDQSLEIIFDGDGTVVYQWVSLQVLDQPEAAALSFELLLKLRADIRAAKSP